MANMQIRNSVTLIGNLGQDPTVRRTDAGLTITEFSLATNENYRDKNGERQTRTDWHRVKAFGKLAEVFAEHLTKGSQVALAGALRYNKWTDSHDQARVSAEVVAHSFTFLGGSNRTPSAAEDFTTGENPLTVAEPAPGYGARSENTSVKNAKTTEVETPPAKPRRKAKRKPAARAKQRPAA